MEFQGVDYVIHLFMYIYTANFPLLLKKIKKKARRKKIKRDRSKQLIDSSKIKFRTGCK